MAERFRHEAREWLKASKQNWLYDRSKDVKHGSALVEDLYRAGAIMVEIGVAQEGGAVADTLFITLPGSRDEALEVMALLAWQQGSEVELVGDGKAVVRIWWA